MTKTELFDLRSYMHPGVVEAYKAFQPKALAWWRDPKNETTRLGLNQSTVRAISTGKRGANGPLAIFEEWAQAELAKMKDHPRILDILRHREGFESWHAELVESLVAHWRGAVRKNNDVLKQAAGVYFVPVNEELSVAHRYKLVDLFVRYIRMRAAEYPELARCCYEFGHIPLDRKSIAIISAAFGGLGAGAEFSMSDITSVVAYHTYQRLAQAICAEAGGTPLLLDVFSLEAPYAQALYAQRKKQSRRAKRGTKAVEVAHPDA